MSCPPRICPNDFRTYITVQKPMSQKDGQGGLLPTAWVEHFRCYAKVEWESGREVINSGRVQAVTTAKITTYYDSRFTTSHRLVFEGRTLNIRDVTDVGQWHIASELTAEEGVGT